MNGLTSVASSAADVVLVVEEEKDADENCRGLDINCRVDEERKRTRCSMVARLIVCSVCSSLCSVCRKPIIRRRGRRSVRVGYYVSLLVVAMKCGRGVTRAYRGANEGVAMNAACSSCFR